VPLDFPNSLCPYLSSANQYNKQLKVSGKGHTCAPTFVDAKFVLAKHINIS
jgi:hypothetical protein